MAECDVTFATPWIIYWPRHFDPDPCIALSGCLGCDFGLDVPCRGLSMLGLCLD